MNAAANDGRLSSAIVSGTQYHGVSRTATISFLSFLLPRNADKRLKFFLENQGGGKPPQSI
jgi:hypothetical protein